MILNSERFKGVHKDMRAVVELAATFLDFNIRLHEGVRSVEQQRINVDNGSSQTMDSRHITGHAVDLLACVDIDRDGKLELEELYSWQMAYKICAAMKRAAAQLNVSIVWGGCWDRLITEINDPETAYAEYVLRRRKRNLKAFGDGPHYELSRKVYP